MLRTIAQATISKTPLLHLTPSIQIHSTIPLKILILPGSRIFSAERLISREERLNLTQNLNIYASTAETTGPPVCTLPNINSCCSPFPSLSSHIPFHSGRDTRGFTAANHTTLPIMVSTPGHINCEYGCMPLRLFLRHQRRWQ